MSHVALNAARARNGPDETQGFRILQRYGSRPVEPLLHARRLPEELHRFRDVTPRDGHPRPQDLCLRGEEVESDAAGPEETAPEPRAADLRRHVQEVPAQASAVGRGGEIGDVARQGSEVADVVREPLELQRDAADRVGARGDPRPGQGLDRVRVGQRVADRRVARDRLHVRQRSLRRPPDERPLDTAMLVAEGNLEVEYLLAVTLEPKMPRLDHARMNRADRDLVHLVARDPEEVRHARRDRGVRRPAPGVVAGTIGVVVPHRLKPGVPLERHAVLLGNLALEEMRLRDLRDEGRKGSSVAVRARDGESPVRIVREHRHETDAFGFLAARRIGGRAEIRYDTPSLVAHAVDEPPAKLRGLERGHVLQREGAPVPGRDARGHEAPSRVFAAARTRP